MITKLAPGRVEMPATLAAGGVCKLEPIQSIRSAPVAMFKA